MKTVISILGWRRPEYLKEVLDGLRACRGIENYDIITTVDGDGDGRVVKFMESIDFGKSNDLHVSLSRNGCNASVLLAIERAFFDGADRVIVFEDDVVPGPDCLEFFEATLDKFQADGRITTVGAYSKNDSILDLDHLYEVETVEWFRPWGVGYWADKFEQVIRPHWIPYNFGPMTWDTHIMNYMNSQHYLQCKPKFSRVQNIGAEGGAHTFSPEWHNKEVRTTYWTGNCPVSAGKFVY